MYSIIKDLIVKTKECHHVFSNPRAPFSELHQASKLGLDLRLRNAITGCFEHPPDHVGLSYSEVTELIDRGDGYYVCSYVLEYPGIGLVRGHRLLGRCCLMFGLEGPNTAGPGWIRAGELDWEEIVTNYYLLTGMHVYPKNAEEAWMSISNYTMNGEAHHDDSPFLGFATLCFTLNRVLAPIQTNTL